MQVVVPSRYDRLDVVAGAVTGVTGSGADGVLLAVHEAVVNAIRHGNREDPAAAVTVTAERDGPGLVVTVTDDGPGFDPSLVPDPRRPGHLLHPHGRGLLLIRAAFDRVDGTRRDGRFVLTLRSTTMATFDIATRTTGGVTILGLSGKLVIGEDAKLSGAVNEALNSGATKILLDFAKVATVDSGGIGALISAYTTATSRGAKLKLVNLPPKITDILVITQLITIFEVFDTEAEAVASF